MSLTILLMNKDSIYAIADKRVSKKDYSFVHDNEIKLRPIRKDLFLGGIGECDISNAWHPLLKSMSHLSVTEVVNVASHLPRTKQVHVSKEFPCCAVVIFGKDDHGDLFLWLGHPDGSTETIYSSSNIICRIFGMNTDNSPTSTVNRVSDYNYNLLIKGCDIEESLIKSLQFGSTIDPVVSPTYDTLKISKNLNLN